MAFTKVQITGDAHYTTDLASRIITDQEISQINAIQDAIDGLNVTVSDLNKLAGAGERIASGTQAAHIQAPEGGAVIDEQARQAISAILSVLEAFGITAA